MSKLSARAKEAEERTAAARSQAKADLEKSANEARPDAQAQVDRLRDTASATEARISASWNDLQSSWADHIAKVRQNIDAKKAELDAKSAPRSADIAEKTRCSRLTTRMRLSRRRNTPCSTLSLRGWTPTS
jgi:hypothetical protein